MIHHDLLKENSPALPKVLVVPDIPQGCILSTILFSLVMSEPVRHLQNQIGSMYSFKIVSESYTAQFMGQMSGSDTIKTRGEALTHIGNLLKNTARFKMVGLFLFVSFRSVYSVN